MRQLHGHLADSARRQNTAEKYRSPPQGVLRARWNLSGGIERYPTELFYHRYDVCDSSATGVSTEDTNSIVCMFYRPYQSVRLRFRNPPLNSTRLVWLGTEYDLGHSSISRWHASIRAARRQGVLGVVRCETGPSPRVRARAPPVQHIFRGDYKHGLHALQGGQKHHGGFDVPEKEKGGGGAGEATAGEPFLATPLWGMLYAGNARVVSQPPEQLRKMMGMVVVVFTYKRECRSPQPHSA